jgi:predicted MPP superfamily phosphohydrolase
MLLFLITFLSLYGGMHLYALLCIQRAFRPHRAPLLALRSLMCLGTGAPFLVRICEQSGLEKTTQALAWSGYSWMGFIFILVSALIPLDLLRLALSRISPPLPRFLGPRTSCQLAILFAISASCYGFFEAREIRVEHLTIPSFKLPPTVTRIRIVQLSDVHLGLVVRENRLKRMLSIVREAEPDILVSTGDLIDGRLSRREGSAGYRTLTAMLRAVRAPWGKFAVTGNHEYYAGLDQSLEVTRAAGFRVLRNEAVSLANGMVISGCDDAAWKRISLSRPEPDETKLLGSLPPDRFRLHLKHRPLVDPRTEGLFDLQLSGHTHRGQIFPFYLLTRFSFPIPSGTTRLRNGSMIHVSRGTGTWGPPIRFLAPPEITVIDIVPTVPTGSVRTGT